MSLHAPLNDSTRGWFDADKISAMRDGAVLVNCARGAIVDNDALAAALNGDKLSGGNRGRVRFLPRVKNDHVPDCPNYRSYTAMGMPFTCGPCW